MRVFCILGDGRIFKSKSPVMHTEVLRRRGIGGVYVPFHVEQNLIGDAIKGIRALGIAGANVTVPHKEVVIPHLDVVSEEAKIIGAVNTIVRRGGLLEGHNTDVGGFMDALSQAEFRATDKTALVFGAGGASKAVLFALHKMKIKGIFLTNRSLDRAKLVSEFLGAEVVPYWPPKHIVEAADLVVNTTSVSGPGESPEMARMVESLSLRKCSLVLDINYGRRDNFWADAAAANSVKFMDGIPMLVHQARLSFRHWTSLEVTSDEFFEALKGAS